MSLKAFHMLFVAMSVMLAAFVAAWGVAQYRAVHELGYIAASVGSAGAGVALAVYGTKFRQKTRHL